jgi:spermidine/putrescine-binding protein
MRRHRKFKVIVLLSGLIFIFGCSNPSEQADQSSIKMEKEVQDRTLVLYNWEEYIGAKTLENFEKETGIHVKEINFQDEEEMLGAVQSEPGNYDLVVASDDLIREMREARLLVQLNLSKIPNIKYIDTKYLNRDYDPEQKYSIPYLTGTTGMVVNKNYIKEGTDSWKVGAF